MTEASDAHVDSEQTKVVMIFSMMQTMIQNQKQNQNLTFSNPNTYVNNQNQTVIIDICLFHRRSSNSGHMNGELMCGV